MIRAAKNLNKINVYNIRNNLNKSCLSTSNGAKPPSSTQPKSFINDKSSSSGSSSSDKNNSGGGGSGGGSKILYPLVIVNSALAYTILSLYSTLFTKDEKLRQNHEKYLKSLGLSSLSPYLIQFGKSDWNISKYIVKAPPAKPSTDVTASTTTISPPPIAPAVAPKEEVQPVETKKEEIVHSAKEVLEEVEKKVR